MQLTGPSSFAPARKPVTFGSSTGQPPRRPVSDSFLDTIGAKGKTHEENYFAEQERILNEAIAKPEVKALMTTEAVPAAGDQPALTGRQLLDLIRKSESKEDALRLSYSDKPLALAPDLLRPFSPARQDAVKAAVRKLYQHNLIEADLHPRLTYDAPGLKGGGNKNIIQTANNKVEGLKTSLIGKRALMVFKES